MVGLGRTLVPSTIREALQAGRRNDDAVSARSPQTMPLLQRRPQIMPLLQKKAADDAAAAKKAAEYKVELLQHGDFSGW